MPKYAILFSIATAIAGQTIGSRMERRRIAPVKPASLVTSSGKPVLQDQLSHSSSGTSGGDARVRRARISAACGAAQEYFQGVNASRGSRAAGVEDGGAVQQPHEPAVLPLVFKQSQRAGAGVSGRCGAQLIRSRPGGQAASELPPSFTLVS